MILVIDGVNERVLSVMLTRKDMTHGVISVDSILLNSMRNGKTVNFHGQKMGITSQNQNQNSLLLKRQNDNTSPGDWPSKISP